MCCTHRITQLIFATLVASCLLAVLASGALAQDDSREEIVVSFQVRRLLAADLYAWYDGEQIFLPVGQVFDLLDLPVEIDLKKGIITGHVIDRRHAFRFDLTRGEVTASGKRTSLPAGEYIAGETEFFLRVDQFEYYLGLPMQFNFADLRVTLPLNEEFPAFRKMQRTLAHRQLQLHEEKLGDVKNLPYRRSLLGGAVADWSLSATPVGGGAQYVNLSMGAMIAGGDLSLGATGNSETGFSNDQFTWRWHYFVDTANFITQIEAGDLLVGGSGGPLGRQLRGVAVTNKPQTQRQYFRTVTIDGTLGEGWEVELYVDQKLIDFVYTDLSGRYEFDVDLYYGASVVTLKMYGPDGEIRTEEQYLRVPYNLIPEKTIEYAALVGQQPLDSLGDWYGQASAFYGVSRNITTGLGIDIPLGSQVEESPAWEIQTCYQPVGNLTLNGAYSPGYVASFDFNYNKPSVLSLDGGVSTYFENDERNLTHLRRTVMLSMSSPLVVHRRRLNFRYYLAWNTFEQSDQINMHFGFNSSFRRINFYYLGKYRAQRYNEQTEKNLSSEVFASVFFTRWFRPQFRIAYDHTENRLSRVAFFLNKRVFRTGQLGFSAERDMASKTNVFRVTFSLFTDFADFSSRAAYANGQATLNQVQQGSVRYDQKLKRILFDRYFGVGRSTAVVRPFLDDNFNGMLDENEEPVAGLRARVQGGREKPRDDRSTYYYEGLNPYDEHLVQIDPTSLDNPLLKPTYEGYRVPLNPNMVTMIDVPLVMTGEVEGMVRRRTGAGEIGLGGIKVQFYHQTKESITEVMSFSNGDFFYLGLIPGRYRAAIDPEQLKRLGCTTEPEFIEFDLEAAESGASVTDINFLLLPIETAE